MSLGLGRVALCSRCPMGSIGAVSLITWGRCSKGVPGLGYMCPHAVVEPWLLLACQWVGLTGCEEWPWLQWGKYFMGVDTMKWDSLLVGFWCLLSVPLGKFSFVELVSLCSGVVWSQPLHVLVVGFLESVSHAGQVQLLSLLSLGPPGRSCQVICGWFPPVLGLEFP